MQESHLFEYAIVRVVPKVERGEFINIGVVLYCARLKFLTAMFHVDPAKILSLSPTIDMEELNAYLNAYMSVCKGGDVGGPIGRLPVPERFRWLTATRSTILQSSPVHNGLCEDPQQKIEQLFDKLVL